MSHPDFANKGDLIGRFIEECGEALAAAGKCVRFGRYSYNPLVPEDQRETNIKWLMREISDVEEVIRSLKSTYSSFPPKDKV